MSHAEPELLGREDDLAVLEAAVERARSGRGVLAVVSGEAGIGKSALAAAVAARAEAAGCVVTRGKAWELGEAPAYFPVRPCLSALGIESDASRYRADDGAFRLWEDVVAALARVSATCTSVWVLEDVHAADLLTLDLLTFLGQAARALRVVVVVTVRTLDPRVEERASTRIGRLARDGLDVRLEPLGAEHSADLARRWARRDLAPDKIAEIVDLTGGNPLFVVECARAAGGARRGSALPATIRQTVQERLAGLPVATREALARGAVVGRDFAAAVVARMQRTLPARVIDDVLPALRSGIVVETAPGRFAFSHAIVRDVVEDALSAAERAGLHAQAEAALSADGDAPEVVVERARHALAAAMLDDSAHARDLARRAAEVLEAQGAFDRAHAIYERIAIGATNEERLHHAAVASLAGRVQAAKRICTDVADAARRAGDPATFARAVLHLGAELRPAIVDDTLVELLREAIAMLRDTDEGLACRLDARLAAALQPAVDAEVPVAMARAAIARARVLGDEAVLLDVLDKAVSALVDFAPVDERLAAYRELLDRALRAGDRPRALRSYCRLALDHVSLGDFAAFDEDVDHALALATELGHPRFRWRALLLGSMRALASGDLATSERCVVEVRQLAGLTDDPALPLSLTAHACGRAILLHDEAELRETARTLESAMAGVPHAALIAAVYRAGIHARLEDPVAAATELGRARAALPLFEREATAAAPLVEAYALAGTDEQRRRMRDLLARELDRESQSGHVPMTYDGPVRRGVALLDGALGDVAAAEAGLGQAMTKAVERGHRPWVAQLVYDRARIRAQTGRRAAAIADCQESATLAEELGIVGLARRARALAEGLRSGSDPRPIPAVARVPSRAAAAVAREGDVWRVVVGSREVRVRDSRGMQLLARLVDRPDEEIHVLALASDEGGALVETSAGDILDDRAKRAYRERLRELAASTRGAEQRGDVGQLERDRRERAMLERELARAVGLGGRSRASGSATERARVNVQRRLKDAIARVADVDAEVGAYLGRAVRTGTFCCFRP